MFFSIIEKLQIWDHYFKAGHIQPKTCQRCLPGHRGALKSQQFLVLFTATNGGCSALIFLTACGFWIGLHPQDKPLLSATNMEYLGPGMSYHWHWQHVPPNYIDPQTNRHIQYGQFRVAYRYLVQWNGQSLRKRSLCALWSFLANDFSFFFCDRKKLLLCYFFLTQFLFIFLSDINECMSQVCNAQFTQCENSLGSYQCVCIAGYTNNNIEGALCVGKYHQGVGILTLKRTLIIASYLNFKLSVVE